MRCNIFRSCAVLDDWQLTRPRIILAHYRMPKVHFLVCKNENWKKKNPVTLRMSHGDTMQKEKAAAAVVFYSQLHSAGGISHLALRAINVVKTNLPRVEWWFILNTQVFRFGLNRPAAIVIGVVSQWRSQCKHCGLVCSRTAHRFLLFYTYCIHKQCVLRACQLPCALMWIMECKCVWNANVGSSANDLQSARQETSTRNEILQHVTDAKGDLSDCVCVCVWACARARTCSELGLSSWENTAAPLCTLASTTTPQRTTCPACAYGAYAHIYACMSTLRMHAASCTATALRVCVSLEPCDLACSKHVPVAINYFLFDFDGSGPYDMWPRFHVNGNYHIIDWSRLNMGSCLETHCLAWLYWRTSRWACTAYIHTDSVGEECSLGNKMFNRYLLGMQMIN